MKMEKSKELAKNTGIFAIGTIGSKLMLFLLVPIYTLFLKSSEYSAADLIVSTVFLLSPLLTIGIGNGVLRFVLDRPENRGKVLKLCLYIVLVGFLFLLMFIPLLNSLEIFSGYGYLVPFVFVCYSVKHIFANYCKAVEKNLLYSVDGILSALTLTVFSVIFLAVAHMGILGYVLATTISLLISIFFFLAKCDIVAVLRRDKIDIKLSKEVIKYAFPLMPNELSWWVVQMSNRYILVFFCGAAVNGVFSMAYKLPGIFNLIVSIFIQAFGITAIKECNQENRLNGKIDGSYFSKIYEKYCAVTFLSVLVVIMASKPLAIIFLKNEFSEAWKYVPFLLCAYAIGNLQSFYGSIYGGLKRTGLVFLSTLLGAATSVALNFVLVPRFGAFGACFAAIASYCVIYIARLLGLKKNIVMQHFVVRNLVSIILVILTSILYVKGFFYYSFGGLVLAVILYRKTGKEMFFLLGKISKKLKGRL